MSLLIFVVLFIVLKSTIANYDYYTNPITYQDDITDEIESKDEMTITFNQSIGKSYIIFITNHF